MPVPYQPTEAPLVYTSLSRRHIQHHHILHNPKKNRFEGATATALSDSMKLPAKTDPDKGQSVSWNMITSRPVREAPGANAKPIGTSSWATTAPPVKSLALTGPANYRFALAQAGEAVAMSQIERTTSDRLPKNLREQEQEQNQQGKRRRLLLRWQQQSQSSHSRSSNNSVH